MSIAPAPTATTETFLGGFGTDPAALSVVASAFGELVKLAAPVVERYHSDLFRDAEWLQANLTADVVGGALTFWYVVRTNGTYLVQDTQWLAAVRNAWQYDEALQVYSVAVLNRRGSWIMLIAPEASA